MRKILFYPFYAIQLLTGAKSFAANPLLASPKLNAKNLHLKRVKLAVNMANWRRKKLARRIKIEHVEQYEKSGYIKIENFLPDEVFKEVIREIDAEDFVRHDMRQGSTVTRRASIDHNDLVDKPALSQVRNDRYLKDLIRYVSSHGGQPLLTLQIVLAQAATKQAAGKKDPQTLLHSDTFHSTAKCWLFLKDVGSEDGPFKYVPGSHKMTPQRYAWEKDLVENILTNDNRYSVRGSFRIAQEALATLGYPQPEQMTVQANTLIVADTHGFHARSSSFKPTTRMEIYGSLRRNPFLPFTGLHLAALPFVRNNVGSSDIKVLELLERMGIRSSPWKRLPNGKLDDWPQDLKKD